MTALTVMTWVGLSLQLSVGIAVGIAIGILIAQLGSARVKKFGIALVLVFTIATAFGHVMYADDFVILDPCKGLTPSDWQWYAYGCFWP